MLLLYTLEMSVVKIAWKCCRERCNGFVFSARHVLCEKQGKINEAYKKLQDGWLSNGDKVPPAEFAKVKIP